MASHSSWEETCLVTTILGVCGSCLRGGEMRGGMEVDVRLGEDWYGERGDCCSSDKEQGGARSFQAISNHTDKQRNPPNVNQATRTDSESTRSRKGRWRKRVRNVHDISSVSLAALPGGSYSANRNSSTYLFFFVCSSKDYLNSADLSPLATTIDETISTPPPKGKASTTPSCLLLSLPNQSLPLEPNISRPGAHPSQNARCFRAPRKNWYRLDIGNGCRWVSVCRSWGGRI